MNTTTDKPKLNLDPHIKVPNHDAISKTPFDTEEIALVTGKLGAGKSMFLMCFFIWPELTKGKRTVVTNLRLNLPAIREALQAYTSRDGSEVFDRIRCLSDDEMQQFWLHRGRYDGENFNSSSEKTGWWDSQDVKITEKGRGENEISDYLPNHPHYHGDTGILYVYDEAHKGLRARDWMSFGRTGEWYFNLIRHCGDTVVMACPHPTQIDKYVSNLFQKVYGMRNGKKEKFLKFFKGPKRFFWTQYEGPYMESGMPEQASGRFELTPWLANCYNTSMFGGDADKNKGVKGLPFKLFPVALVLIAVMIICAPKIMQVGFSAWLRSLMPGGLEKRVAVQAVATNTPAPAVRRSSGTSSCEPSIPEAGTGRA